MKPFQHSSHKTFYFIKNSVNIFFNTRATETLNFSYVVCLNNTQTQFLISSPSSDVGPVKNKALQRVWLLYYTIKTQALHTHTNFVHRTAMAAVKIPTLDDVTPIRFRRAGGEGKEW